MAFGSVRLRVRAGVLGCVGMITGCNGDDGGDDDGALPECIEFDATACAPLYQPTYANVFAQTLQP
ncbi:MAG: hypothetical protein IAG13_12500, partial [Deltaproteobacteria bacterium]|nr:hypothetical protein [Nannocystaceae bacterium]